MRILGIVPLLGLIGLFLAGCAASGAGSRAGEAFTPASSAIGPTQTPAAAASTPMLTPARATPGAVRTGPSSTPTRIASVFRPKPLPSGFSVAPNWLAFQPARRSNQRFELENFVWLTDGQRWIGPFPFYPSSSDVEFITVQRDGAWKACWQENGALPDGAGSCWTSLPDGPPMPRKILETECLWPIAEATARCDLAHGMPAPQVQIPNPFHGLEGLCADCWQTVTVSALEGDSAMLVMVSAEEGQRWPRHLYVLRPGETPRALLPPEEHEGGTSAVPRFSPDGRFLLINDFSQTGGTGATWIVRWPQGDSVSLPWPGRAMWVEPRLEPTASFTDTFQPEQLPSGFSVAPNWLVFQPLRPDGDGREDRIWLTDGQQWIGPFPLTEGLFDGDFFMVHRDGTWQACRRDACIAPLPGEPPGSRKVLEANCQGDIQAATVSCDLPPGMPVSQVRIPNPFRGLKEVGKVWVEVTVRALEGDPTMLVSVTWDKEWGPMEVPSRPDVHLYVLQPGGAPRVLLPKKDRKKFEIALDSFSPDGRFLLILDFALEAGEFTTWIVRWPEGERLNLPGNAIWLEPRSESLGR
ncbi:MAG TPA: hypothetical protein VNK89_12555 [Thermoflexus sp.]|nr:hypothetical protein [Thermoflexus sp.]